MLKDILMAVVSFLCGAGVSKYFFSRSLSKSLTPYFQFSSAPLEKIDPKVREKLSVNYQGYPIESLYEVQFLIANTGDTHITDIIEPLTLIIPKGCQPLDVSILYVSPVGRDVQTGISGDSSKVNFIFPFLNSGEFFIVKLLMDGIPNREEQFNFYIKAIGLPPLLQPSILSFEALSTTKRRKFEVLALLAGLLTLLFGIVILKLSSDHWNVFPSLKEIGILKFILGLDSSAWASLLGLIPASLFCLLGPLLIVSSFVNVSISFPMRKKFIIPENKELSRLSWPKY